MLVLAVRRDSDWAVSAATFDRFKSQRWYAEPSQEATCIHPAFAEDAPSALTQLEPEVEPEVEAKAEAWDVMLPEVLL
jgi:hypothetical protein